MGTIRDAILTCAQKPTRVSLVYRTKLTTKKLKTEKLKSKKTDMLRSVSKQSRKSSPEEGKRGYGGKDLQRMAFLTV